MEKKQKILIVHNYYQIPGGEDTVVANEKKLLEDHGHEVILYSRHNNELNSMKFFRKLLLPFATIFNLRTYQDIKRIIEEKKIDIVHVHNTLFLISPAVYYAALKIGVPVVQTVHNFRFICPGATLYRNGHICEECLSKGLQCAIKNKCYRGSRIQTLLCVINILVHKHIGIFGKIYYICLTEFNKNKLLNLKQITPEKVFIKPNFAFEHPDFFSTKNHTKYLFVGRIEEIKGIRLVFNAFLKMPERQLELAGDGPLLDEMMKLIENKEYKNITFLGRIEHEKILEKMKQARAIIIPSQVYESFPMIIPESFSVSTPVIAGDIGNLSILIKQNVTGEKFVYNSEESLINAIKRFEQLDQDNIRDNCFNEFKDKYSAKQNYELLEKIYCSIQ